MNAYELADHLEKYFDAELYTSEVATMLRHQADRIAELENPIMQAIGMAFEKPLSDEEIDKILESLDVYIDTHAGVKLFVRAIEERHGIK